MATSSELSYLAKKTAVFVTDEGRHFLTTRPEGSKYDLIYLGANAATTAVTGHTTKYLDTVEAYHAYLDLLAPGGLMVFDHQPLEERIQNLRVVFEQRGLPDFADPVVIVDDPKRSDDGMILAPDGFSAEEIEAMWTLAREGDNKTRRRLLVPNQAKNQKS